MIDDHNPQAIFCIFLPSSAIWKKEVDFRFDLSVAKLKVRSLHSVLTYFLSFLLCEKVVVASTEPNLTVKKAIFGNSF
jgi:hypothetical protein